MTVAAVGLTFWKRVIFAGLAVALRFFLSVSSPVSIMITKRSDCNAEETQLRASANEDKK